jgi:hypothetical protein
LRRRLLRIGSSQLGGLGQSTASNKKHLHQSVASTTGLGGGYINRVGDGALDTGQGNTRLTE